MVKLTPCGLIFACKVGVIIVPVVKSEERERRHVAELIFTAAVDKILDKCKGKAGLELRQERRQWRLPGSCCLLLPGEAA